ncbi:F0F1 ATP synthase subunit delta [Rathayibacter sp. CAU 1779]
MGSATTGALGALRSTLAAQQGVDRQTAEDLFSAARTAGSSVQLRSVLGDASADPTAKTALVRAIFGGKVTASAQSILEEAVAQRWSDPADLPGGLEELGIRALASTAHASDRVDAELFEVARAVSSDAQLELALRSKLGPVDAKVALVDRLLGDKSSNATHAIVRELVQRPAGRSIREALRWAAEIVADQAGATLATVITAAPLDGEQLERLRGSLSRRYGRDLVVNAVVQPSLIGGVRVQIGDDVIDSSISARLGDVRQKLAG